MRDARTRKSLSGRDFGLAERGVVLELLTPKQGQFERVRTVRRHFGASVVFTRNVPVIPAGNGVGERTKGVAPQREKGMPTVRGSSQELRV